MADSSVSGLTEKVTPHTGDDLLLEDNVAAQTKRIRWSSLIAALNSSLTFTSLSAQASGAEITAGTETALRSHSPADIVSYISQHETGGGGGGSGDVVGPASATDNAVARYSTTTGKLIQASGVIIDDSNNITGVGTVDGRDIAADGTKLDGVESGATADQTGAQIKAAYEAEANAYTDTLNTKLNGIEASADVTDETNVVAALNGATLSDIGTPAAGDKILIQDITDSDNLKYVTFDEFGGGGGGTVEHSIKYVSNYVLNTDYWSSHTVPWGFGQPYNVDHSLAEGNGTTPTVTTSRLYTQVSAGVPFVSGSVIKGFQVNYYFSDTVNIEWYLSKQTEDLDGTLQVFGRTLIDSGTITTPSLANRGSSTGRIDLSSDYTFSNDGSLRFSFRMVSGSTGTSKLFRGTTEIFYE